MRVARNTPLMMDKPPAQPNQRRYGRIRCANLHCEFIGTGDPPAEVLDMSASGMRLRFPRGVSATEGGVLSVTLSAPSATLKSAVRIIWMRRVGFRRFEVGVTFTDPTEELRKSLAMLMRATSDNLLVYGLNTPRPQ